MDVRVDGGEIFCMSNSKEVYAHFKGMNDKFGNVSYTTESTAPNGNVLVRTVPFAESIPYIYRYSGLNRFEVDKLCDEDIKAEKKFYADNPYPKCKKCGRDYFVAVSMKSKTMKCNDCGTRIKKPNYFKPYKFTGQE